MLFKYRIRSTLNGVFRDLLDQLNGEDEHYEVIVTFNAVLHSPTNETYSVFYGHDFRPDNLGGRAAELGLNQNSTIVRNLYDVERIPTNIDYDNLMYEHRDAFESSSVHIHSFINIIYLIYKYVPTVSRRRRRRR